jgi:hypothetical protein
MTSEDQYNIEAQPPPQCPTIDAIIDKLEFALDNMEIEDERTSDIYASLVNLPDEMENIREAFKSMRTWGEGWKQLARKHLKKNEPCPTP